MFSDGEAYEGTQVLKTVIQDGTGTAANYGCPAAGKTGTAENYDNAWFVGYTPKLSTAVWVGYPQGNIQMANGFGGTLAAPIWRQFMLRRRRATAATSRSRPTRSSGQRSPARIRRPRSRRRPRPQPGQSALNNPTLFAQPGQNGTPTTTSPDRWREPPRRRHPASRWRPGRRRGKVAATATTTASR